MAIDQRKRQRKLERKAAKRRAVALQSRIAAGYVASLPRRMQIEAAAQSPIHQCLVGADIFKRGMGTVVFSRRLGDGRIAAGIFLLDTYCLGVKNAFLAFMSKSDFALKIRDMGQANRWVSKTPAYARKLVEDAVAYASALGLSPHADYHEAKSIFGDVNAGECPELFAFGQNGKPHFIAGPNDTPAKCQRIIDALHERLGPDGFHYTIPFAPEDLDDLEFTDVAGRVVSETLA